jgi:hypothetical protein
MACYYELYCDCTMFPLPTNTSPPLHPMTTDVPLTRNTSLYTPTYITRIHLHRDTVYSHPAGSARSYFCFTRLSMMSLRSITSLIPVAPLQSHVSLSVRTSTGTPAPYSPRAPSARGRCSRPAAAIRPRARNALRHF